jgi:hypothetical protein
MTVGFERLGLGPGELLQSHVRVVQDGGSESQSLICS